MPVNVHSGLLLRLLLLCFPFSLLWLGCDGGALGLEEGQEPLTPDSVWLSQREAQWVDSVLTALTPRERILQSMVVSAYSRGDRRGDRQVKAQVQMGVGGVLFFQGTTERQDSLTRVFQSQGRIPLLICLDAEWGSAMRLSDGMNYPRAMALGATGMPQLSYRVGRSLGANLRAMGVHVSFSPVVDVNRESANPIVNLRAFGDSAAVVAEHGLAMQMGLQSVGILPCVKHFPGHGALQTDSHHALPYQPADRALLEASDLLPFRRAVEAGVGMVMVGHIEVPALGCRRHEPASLSPAVMRFLRDSMHFQGLICTDALNMAGALAGGHTPDSAAYLSYAAGSDLLLCVDNPQGVLRLLEDALTHGRITQEQVDLRCRRVLRAKWRHVVAPGLYAAESAGWRPRASDSALVEEVAVSALTLLQGERVPLGSMIGERVGYLSYLESGKDFVAPMLSRYIDFDTLKGAVQANETHEQAAQRMVGGRTLMVVTLGAMAHGVKGRFGLRRDAVEMVRALAERCPTVVMLFGSPYAVLYSGWKPEAFAGLLLSYGDSQAEQEAAAQALMGAKPIEGSLPVRMGALYPRGAGLQRAERLRLGYCSPAYLGADSAWIARADSLARLAMDSLAAPGFQVVAAKDGEIFYQRTCGTFTYSAGAAPVREGTLFDVASLTKVLVTTPLVMYYVERGLLRLEDTLGLHLAECRGSALGRVKVDELLQHRSGLPAGYPFVQLTLENLFPQSPLLSRVQSAHYPLFQGSPYFLGRDVVLSPRWFRDAQSQDFDVPVARNLWGVRGLRDSMMRIMRGLRLDRKRGYLYSDLGFILLGWLVERVGRQAGDGETLGALAQRWLLAPCGLRGAGFNPWARGLRGQCAPSCHDALYRKAVVQGYAHDMAAAFLGGEAGHAGLFCSARDAAAIAQMLLQRGEYGGQRFISARTVEQFTTSVQQRSGRSYGFARKVDGTSPALVGPSLGVNSYGHSGFTGSVIWLDPETNFLFVFLSNRTWPSDQNNRLTSLSIRGGMMEAVYRSLLPQSR